MPPNDSQALSAVGPTRHREWVMSLVQRYEPRLTRYAERLTGDLHSARDVVQHVFLRLCDESADSIQRPEAWLYTVCHRRALDIRRQAIRLVQLETSDHAADGHARRTDPTSRERDPYRAAELKETGQLLQRAVDLLPEAQRQVVNLWAEGFCYRDISQILGRGEAYIRVLMHRALAELRRHPFARQFLTDAAVAASPNPES
ncbi:MAG TPA: RNA polymerase sigma factor [Pirellulales bacterium]|nr:RNA polymerase sigma factor [Pirellulales bacterium]